MQLSRPGLVVTKAISAYEAELEVDVSTLELNQFVAWINEASVIQDLTIQNPPIETLIKALYVREEN